MYVVSPALYLEGMLGVPEHPLNFTKKIENNNNNNFFGFFFLNFSGLLELKSSFCAGLRIVKTSNSKLDSIRAF